jgi:hypothetical protein
VLDEAGPMPGPAYGLADLDPVAGQVAGPSIPRAIDEGLSQQHAVPVLGLPVPAEPAQVGAEHLGGQAVLADPRQDQKPGVVHHPGQIALAGLGIPADERFPWPIVQRWCAPHQQRHELVADECRVANRLASRLHETEVVIPLHVQPEAGPLDAFDRSNRERTFGLALDEARYRAEDSEHCGCIRALMASLASNPPLRKS